MTSPATTEKQPSRPALSGEPASPPTARRRSPERAARLRRVGLRLLALIVLLALWQLVTALRLWSPLLVPPPSAVWDALVETSGTHDGVRGYQGHTLIEHLGISLRRIAIGAGAGVLAGLVAGVLMGTLPWVRVVFEPAVAFLRTLPPLAYFSLLIIWFGIDEAPKLWLLAIAAMPPVAVATASAVASAPASLVEAARAIGARRSQVVTSVVLPSALPEILVGVRLAFGIAYSSVVAAETVNGLPGIGGL
ncbi:ABC transporter permease, partial [Streptomyces atroolivaceus]|uniref:ABC transporter permease n=1 Tax=Streptomyces atroolivaceus TaxID=66869 RepID=UPI003686FCBD